MKNFIITRARSECRTKFDVSKSAPDHRLFVYFTARQNYEADVYLQRRQARQNTLVVFTPFAYGNHRSRAPRRANSLVTCE